MSQYNPLFKHFGIFYAFPAANRHFAHLLKAAAAVFAILLNACNHGPAHERPTPPIALDNIEKLPISSPQHAIERDVYVFHGPAQSPPVLLLHELPGLSPNTLRFAQFLAKDFTVYVPLLFGSPNKNYGIFGGVFLLNGEWSEQDEFEGQAINGSRPITQWLAAVVEKIQLEHPKQAVGVIGMCLTGAMPLSLLGKHEAIKAVVVAQPTLPLWSGKDDDLGISRQEWEGTLRRAKAGEIRVYGVRYQNDTIAKRAKHSRLKRELGEGVFLDREIKAEEYCRPDKQGNYSDCPRAHSSLTHDWHEGLSENDPMNVRRREVRDFFRQTLTGKGIE